MSYIVILDGMELASKFAKQFNLHTVKMDHRLRGNDGMSEILGAQ